MSPRVKGPNATVLATFLVRAVHTLASGNPVPQKDDKLKVTADHISNLYSLFKPFPTFLL